jgi:hypothetical protein
MKLDIRAFFRKSVEEIRHWNPSRETVTLHEKVFTFMTISCWILLRMRTFQIKVVGKIEAHISCSVIFFFFENRAICEIISKSLVEPERPQMAIWRRVAWWIIKATRAHPSTRPPLYTPSYTPPPTHTHTEICSTFCITTARMVSLTHLIVTLHVRRLSWCLRNFHSKSRLPFALFTCIIHRTFQRSPALSYWITQQSASSFCK